MKPNKKIWDKLNRRGEKAKYNRLYKAFSIELKMLHDNSFIHMIAGSRRVAAHNLALLAVWDRPEQKISFPFFDKDGKPGKVRVEL